MYDFKCILHVTEQSLSILSFLQFDKFNDKYIVMDGADENELFDMSSCMPSCTRSEFEIMTKKKNEWDINDTSTTGFKFVYTDGQYEEKEQYLMYSIPDFLADVGGYLGLLLGHSILDFYNVGDFAFQTLCKLFEKN
jgi:hypothetical protein